MEDNKEFAACKFTSKQIVEMLEVGISVYQTDEEAFKNQTLWTDLEPRAFHENLRLACEEQEKGFLAESVWDIDATELVHHWGWRVNRKSAKTRVRLCPAPGCLFRPLIATKTADKLHVGCRDIQHAEQKRISKRKERALKRSKHATQSNPAVPL